MPGSRLAHGASGSRMRSPSHVLTSITLHRALAFVVDEDVPLAIGRGAFGRRVLELDVATMSPVFGSSAVRVPIGGCDSSG